MNFDNYSDLDCGCLVGHVLGGEVVVEFCSDHLVTADVFGPIPRRPVLSDPEIKVEQQ